MPFMKNEKSQGSNEANADNAPALSAAFQRAHLRVDVAKQRMRLAKEELKRARKRFKEAKRMAKRARKEAAAARKAWKRVQPKAAKKATQTEKVAPQSATRRTRGPRRTKSARRKTSDTKPARRRAGQSVH
jgi:hypothetical protein